MSRKNLKIKVAQDNKCKVIMKKNKRHNFVQFQKKVIKIWK